MLVSELLSSVRARLRQRGETSAFEDSDIIDYINELLTEISDALEFTRKIVVYTPDSNKRVYMPGDALRVEMLSRNGIELVALTPTEAALHTSDLSTGLGGWYGYTFVNGYYQLGSDSDVAIQYIARLPKIENSNQDMNYREEYRMPIIYGTTQQCFEELGQDAEAARFERKYQKELSDRRETIRGNAFKTRKYPSIPPVES